MRDERSKDMTDKEKKAYEAGVTDKMNNFTMAIKICRERADVDAACAAYVRGYESGVGE